jgi:hypothetical protein
VGIYISQSLVQNSQGWIRDVQQVHVQSCAHATQSWKGQDTQSQFEWVDFECVQIRQNYFLSQRRRRPARICTCEAALFEWFAIQSDNRSSASSGSGSSDESYTCCWPNSSNSSTRNTSIAVHAFKTNSTMSNFTVVFQYISIRLKVYEYLDAIGRNIVRGILQPVDVGLIKSALNPALNCTAQSRTVSLEQAGVNPHSVYFPHRHVCSLYSSCPSPTVICSRRHYHPRRC